MVKEEVIKLRELFSDVGYEITCDNMEKFTNKPETSDEFVLWDDNNEMVYSIRINVNYNTQREKPVVILATTYENIQFIEAISTVDDLKGILDTISSTITHTDTPLSEIKEAFENYQN